MLIAYDKDKNRIYANSGVKYKECFCPDCGEPLIHRVGTHNAPHFAHKVDSNCAYGMDKDAKSPWHIHMQDLFPVDSLERRFYDSQTGELVYIADVYLDDCNTVIEFQHSPISQEDFMGRTLFHINEGRRIVWIFDESKDGAEFGRLKKYDHWLGDWLHKDLNFDWPRSPRKVIASVCKNEKIDIFNNFSVCLYLGQENDIVHRIIEQDIDYKYITLSLNDILLKGDMNVDEFFLPERYWLSQSPWKEMIEERNQIIKARQEAAKAITNKQFFEMMHSRPARRGPRF